jgi:putative oxidoreductase
MFILRVVVGLLFAGHGAQKLFGVFGGYGLAGTAAFFEQIGLRPGRLHATAAGAAEFGGGLLLALGLFSPFAAAVLIATMTAAVITVHLPNGIWVTSNGYEYNVVLAAAAFAVAGAGPGKWSLDNAFSIDDAGPRWAIAAVVVGLVGGLGAVMAGRAGRAEQRTSATPTA